MCCHFEVTFFWPIPRPGQAGAAMGKRASTGSTGSRKKGKVPGNGNQKDAIADTPQHAHVRRLVDWFFGSSIERIQVFNMF